MLDMQFLHAVSKLPEVGTPILRHRDGVLSVLASAEVLEATARQLRDHAAQLERALRVRVMANWSDSDVSMAMRSEGKPHAQR